jgi:glycosyltransferase involved in cell wall biosynthesis
VTRVLLDLSVLATHARRTGIGRYVADLALGLAHTPHDFELLGLVRLGINGEASVSDDVERAVRELASERIPLRGHWSWTYRVRLALGRATRKLGVDLLHSGHPNATPLGNTGCPRIVTCHDLIPLRYPKHYLGPGDGFAAGRRWLDLRRYQSASHVIAVSEATAKDLRELLGIAASKISVVHNGVDLARWQVQDDAEGASARARLGAIEPYVMYTGGADYRKNIGGMCAGLGLARTRPGCRELSLIWAGSLSERAQKRVRAEAVARGVGDAVRLVGYVSDAELRALYGGALSLLFVSYAEGFGYPVVEAMAAGCPVVTSHGSSLAELGAGAAWLVDPDDPSAIATALATLATDDAERMRLRAAGLSRANEFSLERMAEATADVYRRVLASPA